MQQDTSARVQLLRSLRAGSEGMPLKLDNTRTRVRARTYPQSERVPKPLEAQHGDDAKLY